MSQDRGAPCTKNVDELNREAAELTGENVTLTSWQGFGKSLVWLMQHPLFDRFLAEAFRTRAPAIAFREMLAQPQCLACKALTFFRGEGRRWAILHKAEEEGWVMSMVNERAGCANRSMPETPADYLAWINDELEIQQAQLEAYPEETDRKGYIDLLTKVVSELRVLGVEIDQSYVEGIAV
ncbi:MAG: hypothetical protein A4E61_00247 [Syntrophorhabdus sp. PtaB.Bin184]|nr:MAG: hypothetical protein A4E61_00247 [Syntrophorhabdus sp. PtaB.Bin184]